MGDVSGAVSRCTPFRYPRVLRLAEVVGPVARPYSHLHELLVRVRAEIVDAELPVFAPYKRALVLDLVAQVRATGRKTVEVMGALRDVEEELVEQAPFARVDRG